MSTGSDDLERRLAELVPRAPSAGASSEAAFDPAKFEKFCSGLKIDSKERGRIPLTFLGSQRYLVNEIARGLAEDVHTFVILKGRQIGISTIVLALDLYWLYKFKGLQGAVVTDTDENRELFRANIGLLLSTLPPKARRLIKRHNRVQLQLKNGSRFVYMVAGTKRNGELGRAKSANFMHGTECSSWGDEEGFSSLVNTLAQQHPQRLYVLESTARGYNMFYTTWQVAKESKTQRAIFIGWWLNDLYVKEPGSTEYQTYWDGRLTDDEELWVAQVYEEYGVEITDRQLAWWRWYVVEQMKGDINMALQEMPPTEEYAFQLSGAKFFSSKRVNAAQAAARELKALYFRYEFGVNFEDTQFIECTPEEVEQGAAEVTIWETPVRQADVGDAAGCYVMGADPAYGSSEWADEHAGCLLRCYADRVVQVAEIASATWTDVQYAWVLAHVCGWYGDVMLNLEMQGPGGTVYNELGNLRKQAGMFPAGDPRSGAYDVVGRIRDYLWRKQDSMFGQFAYQWQTNVKEKVRLMTTLRGYWERDMITLSSVDCLQQFRNIHRNGDKIGGEGRAKDDRVLALAIAVIAWNDWRLLEMKNAGRTYAHEHRPKEELRMYSPVERSVINYMRDQKIRFRGLA